MTSPPGERSSASSSPSDAAQQVPHQPLPTPQQQPKPSPPPPKPTRPKNKRQRRQPPAEQKPDEQPQTLQVTASAVPGGPILQPYPGPTFIMNPSYPINGSPYGQQPQHPAYPQQAASAPPHSGSPTPMPPPQYAYPVHPAAYPPPPHGYAYPQYAQPMVVYAAQQQRAAPSPDHQQAASPGGQPPPASASSKRKRSTGKSGGKPSDDEASASGSDMARQHAPVPQQSLSELKKRTKTQRACDSCRSRKIRCDILTDADPPVCQHCRQYDFECTFFLPITETRFKKKKVEDDASPDKDKPDHGRPTSSPVAEKQPRRDVGVFATISSRIYESYDQRHNHSWEVSKMGDGLIQVQKPHSEEQKQVQPKHIDLHIERDVIEQLVNAYFADVAPILPVVTKAEFLENASPPPILLYSMCLVAAARREIPQTIFDSIRHLVNNLIKQDDVLSTASIVNVQALLILCMTGDCHSQFVPNALSALWVRLGSAIRMAQDLGLHRTESFKQNIELRRRVWAACVISDRWISVAYGHPSMIDVSDCDARLPSSGDQNDLYMDELVRLSVILGRVHKNIYSPSGLTHATDEMLHALLADINRWKDHLPEDLKFRGVDTPLKAGILHMLYACVCILFWRVFMRISYACPAHLKFSLTVEQWTQLVELTGELIDWLDVHEQAYDVWLLISYATTLCALVQIHTWARRKDGDAVAKLRKLRDTVRRWEGSLSPDHMSARRKAGSFHVAPRVNPFANLYRALLSNVCFFRRQRSSPYCMSLLRATPCLWRLPL
ncbi:hypothetical protein HGRIS_012908 [Hohenbuehelia grisea]|uniref:Zn(2)-C6 fungal-type domain-containing protein n=1 Tax=Hohenbuehelia grisea TaxID=104357 RepID=A0ABR3ITY6_9AGAR